MSVASIANIPNDQPAMNTWAFSHMAHHRDIIRRIREIYKIYLIEYQLDPMPLYSLGGWAYNHQSMHQQMDAVLNIDGFDLTDVNWQDRTQRAEWIWLNFQEHLQVSKILGV